MSARGSGWAPGARARIGRVRDEQRRVERLVQRIGNPAAHGRQEVATVRAGDGAAELDRSAWRQHVDDRSIWRWPSSCRAPRRPGAGTRRWPTISSTVRKAQLGHDLAQLLGHEHHEVHHVLGLAGEASRADWQSCVAMPTGQVSCWQSRCMRQPIATSGMVAKPNSSAPSRAADGHVAAVT